MVTAKEQDGKTVYVVTKPDTAWYDEAADNFTLAGEGEVLGLAQLVNEGNDFAGKTITLTSDLDFSEFAWTPIGNGTRNDSSVSGNAFKGTFDGAGHTITGLTCTGTAAADGTYGLFGVVDGGTVKNVKLAEVSINVEGGENVGAIVGLLTNGGTVSGVEVLSGSVAGGDGVGGLVGRLTLSGTIENCKNEATVSGTGKVGGIVSSAYYTKADMVMTIKDCTNIGTVTSTVGYVGGVVGMSAANISGCTNNGAVTGNATSIGGIVGEQKCYGSVVGCTNTALITNQSESFGTGGIIGWLRYSDETAYEVKAPITVSKCRNTGNVVGGYDAGGIVGVAYNNASVTDCLNLATSLSAKTVRGFLGGIIANVQTTQSPTGIENELTVTGNCSTTTLEQMTGGNCKDVYAYVNDSSLKAGVSDNYNAVAAWKEANHGAWYNA